MDWRVGILSGCVLNLYAAVAVFALAPVRDDMLHYVKPKSMVMKEIAPSAQTVAPIKNEAGHYFAPSEKLSRAYDKLSDEHAPEEDGRYIKVTLRRVQHNDAVQNIAPIDDEGSHYVKSTADQLVTPTNPLPPVRDATTQMINHRAYHRVLVHESLYSIARHYHINYARLAQINKLQNTYHLTLGQKIYLS